MAQDTLHFSVNLDSPIAVYVQIENQVQFAIASGKLAAGDTLPSVREMSQMLGVNPNTVTKAYRDLELMRLVNPRRGVGVSVTPEAPAICQANGPAMALAHLRDAVAECMACGIAAGDVRKAVGDTMQEGRTPYMPN